MDDASRRQIELLWQEIHRLKRSLTDLQHTDAAAQTVALRDGVTAPAPVSGLGLLYVDNADGNVKMAFGDETVTLSGGGGGGVTDHGALTGLADDDHPQYLNTTRHDTTARHGASVVDHGSIGGLGDDDHTQYLTEARHDTTARHGASVVDHGSIGGLSDDDHGQYALLAGRASGQTLSGGNAASETLTLESTSHATKGEVLINPNGGRVAIGGSIEPTRQLAIKSTGQATMMMMTTDDTTGSFAAAVVAANGSDVVGQIIAHDTLRTTTRCGITLGGWAEILTGGSNFAGLLIRA